MATFNLLWALYDRASQVESIGSWLAFVMPVQDAKLRQRLECLGCRLDCVRPILRYCLLAASSRVTSVSEMVYHARDTLQRVQSFFESLSTRQERADELIEIVTHLLGEIDFAVQALNLCVVMLKDNSTTNLPIWENINRKVSPGSLLRASRRLCSFQGDGDIMVCRGVLSVNRSHQDITIREDQEEEHKQHDRGVDEPSSSVLLRLSQTAGKLLLCVASTHSFPVESAIEFTWDMDCQQFVWVSKVANQVHTRYAFVPSSATRTSEIFDFFYTFRLALYDQSHSMEHCTKDSELAAENRLHLLATDDELDELLKI